MGYQAYSFESYPPPGKAMWTNYRITVKDHLENPTEYYFCGYSSIRYIRNPIQMQRPYGSIRPALGARTEIWSILVGGKGDIYQTNIYNELGVKVNYSSKNMNSYDQVTRLARKSSDGNGGWNYAESNIQGKSTLIKLHNSSSEDQQIDIAYFQPLGVDVDTVKRKIKNSDGTFTLKTLVDYNYYSNRDIQSVTDVNGRIISYLWYPNGLPQKITDSVRGDVITFGYDTRQRPYTTSVNGVIVGTTTYDEAGRGTVQG